jgi:hypothetical protein
MKARCVAWLLVFIVVGVSLDSLPDPPAIKSHPGDSQIILSPYSHGHVTRHSLPLCSYIHVSRNNVGWVPIGQHFDTNGPFSPLTPAHHSSDSSPPVSSQG